VVVHKEVVTVAGAVDVSVIFQGLIGVSWCWKYCFKSLLNCAVCIILCCHN
jgi:hypothetical protein